MRCVVSKRCESRACYHLDGRAQVFVKVVGAVLEGEVFEIVFEGLHFLFNEAKFLPRANRSSVCWPGFSPSEL